MPIGLSLPVGLAATVSPPPRVFPALAQPPRATAAAATIIIRMLFFFAVVIIDLT
jgi:hypothetical protein